jgi:hypothetical protein
VCHLFIVREDFTWEIEMDEIFGQRRIGGRRKLKNVAIALTNNALA